MASSHSVLEICVEIVKFSDIFFVIISGDPRRPYPTDLDMRMSFMSRAADMPLGGSFNIPETITTARQISQGAYNILTMNYSEKQFVKKLAPILVIVTAMVYFSEHTVSTPQPGSLSWPPSIDLGSLGSRSDHGGHSVLDSKSHNKENEVEEMNSSDSSSSSSSDE